MTKAELTQSFTKVLQNLLPLRSQRHDGDPPRWRIFERETLLREVNRLRTGVKKKPLGMEQVEQVEILAYDSDHNIRQRLAVGCAELVLDQP